MVDMVVFGAEDLGSDMHESSQGYLIGQHGCLSSCHHAHILVDRKRQGRRQGSPLPHPPFKNTSWHCTYHLNLNPIGQL